MSGAARPGFVRLVRGGEPAPQRVFYWCHTSARQPFETGIPRVVRRLSQALSRAGLDVVPIGREESGGLVEIIGRGPAAFDAQIAAAGRGTVLFIPDLTVDVIAHGANPIRIGQAYGMRTVVLVHDLIPVKLSAHYTDAAVAAFTAYYESVAHADAVLVTSRGVADDLRRFLDGRALRVPPVHVVPLPAQFGAHPRVTAPPPTQRATGGLRLTCLASWERRKNQSALLRAVGRAHRAGVAGIELTLIGRRGADTAFDAEVDALLAQTPGVIVAGPLADLAVAEHIAASDATVYPSLEEGFGLPVLESLWLGRPCICHTGSAMAEVAPGGGTLMLDMADEAAIADGLVRLAREPGLLDVLTQEASARPLRDWDDYAAEVATVLASV